MLEGFYPTVHDERIRVELFIKQKWRPLLLQLL